MAITLAALLILSPDVSLPSALKMPENCAKYLQGNAFIINSEQKSQITQAELEALEPCFKAYFEHMSSDARLEQVSEEAKLKIGLKELGACNPKNFNAALSCLQKHLSPDAKKLISTKDGRVDAHMWLGMFLRNNWGLWSGSELALDMRRHGFTHPDDMSSVIMDAFAAKDAGQEYDLKAQAKFYADYWAKNSKDNK
jgi:hypothetical protein